MTNQKNSFHLLPEKRKNLISLIQEYFLKERNEELGELAASLILDFIIDKIAPEFYNLGINDAYKYLNERIEDVLSLEKI